MKVFNNYGYELTLTRTHLIKKSIVLTRKLALSNLKRALKDKSLYVYCDLLSIGSAGRSSVTAYALSHRDDTLVGGGNIGCQYFDKKNWDKIVRAAMKTRMTTKKKTLALSAATGR